MKKTIAVFAVALPLLLGGAAFAQGDHAGHAHGGDAAVKKTADQPKTVKKQKESKAGKAVLRKVEAKEIGKEAVCPVTGEKLTVKEDTVSASYKGGIYYFCCPGCDKSFMAAPEKYARKKPAAAKAYVCPMGHYEGEKPGKCPKCGMTLKEKEAAKTPGRY